MSYDILTFDINGKNNTGKSCGETLLNRTEQLLIFGEIVRSKYVYHFYGTNYVQH